MKKLSSRIRKAMDSVRRSQEHMVERVKLVFSVSLEERRQAAGLSYADLAREMGTSSAYITKVFRGDSNLTIETMVKLAIATGSDVDVRLVSTERQEATWDYAAFAGADRPVVTGNSVSANAVAANHHWFDEPIAA